MTDLLIESTALEDRLREALPSDVDYASARLVDERTEHLSVRRNELEPVFNEFDTGVMFTVWNGGGQGYAATTDLSAAGLATAVERARYWAVATAGAMVTTAAPTSHASGRYESPVEVTWDSLPLDDRLELLHRQSRLLGIDDRIVDWGASLVRRDVDQLLVTRSRDGESGRIEQRFRFVYPSLKATANEGTNTQTRTFGGHSYCGQGGAEVLGRYGFGDAAQQIAQQALELLDAPNCPTGVMDAILAPDQMILQIHESIGHPLEIDRILGDERNYAGTSFVTADMFGTYQYGSELLNVTFDPTVPGQLASYAFDDDGTPAERQYLIRNGILERGLGGAVSQERSGLPGVANSRAQTWNRPPIDRMANLNVEPGESTVEELIASIEHGVYLHTNNSWSIDDSRNKFQFGCEYGQLIEDGEIVGAVRNPGYRGISSTFWRSLSGVADTDSFTVMGTPNCGKGELNQVIGTGHASPACKFSAIEVFGGEE
ncbi:MAG TPA: TldD/PmbA family protein [Ilumatobacteraceae bacterium]|nr:TldD/PmbA family protein [Ilumatobacteraceae bacterium]